MLDLARGPWLFILFACGILIGHMISAVLPLRPEGTVKFSLIETLPHVAAAGLMSIVFYYLAKRAKDVSDFRRMGLNLAVRYFVVLAALATAAVLILAAIRVGISELFDGPWLRMLAVLWGPVIVVLVVKYRFNR